MWKPSSRRVLYDSVSKGFEFSGDRTFLGSGKSTLLSTISRLISITSGTIAVDGIDISTMEPQQLRRIACTLSQEPLIFDGTLRENLDPTSAHTDAELVNALQICQLHSLVGAAAPNGGDPLSRRVKSAGSDLSAGQRQLLCAARMLLDCPTILLLDEGMFSHLIVSPSLCYIYIYIYIYIPFLFLCRLQQSLKGPPNLAIPRGGTKSSH